MTEDLAELDPTPDAELEEAERELNWLVGRAPATKVWLLSEASEVPGLVEQTHCDDTVAPGYLNCEQYGYALSVLIIELIHSPNGLYLILPAGHTPPVPISTGW